jgi:hypothetical protein
MLLSNCLFRCGAAAMLLSNRRADRRRARFKLLHTVRTHLGQSDECYRAVYQEEDAEGVRGVRLSKQIMQIAGDALKRNITSLGPLILPVSEQLRFFFNLLARKALRGQVPVGPLRKPLAAAVRAIVTIPSVGAVIGYRPIPDDEAESAKAATVAEGGSDGHATANGASRTASGKAQATVAAAIGRSLARMQVPRLDLLQFHWWDYASAGDGIEALRMMDEFKRLPAVNEAQFEGRTALHEAVESGHWEVCEVLLQAGADPGVLDSRGVSCLDLAEAKGSNNMLRRLRVLPPVSAVAN